MGNWYSAYHIAKAGKKSLKNWLHYVPDLIQDI